ncbi:YqjK-like family protein [Undibacterium sp. Jales W-56]|uniref:YqjK-like family protein n=1 Tax=Undibacterium sp. Jales W-56 TaxID=2897325 RepID=UPI0021D2A813|nr:YqjK-like family protein [Undibacterium sp. Jales W-56]MCU6432411.1 YqjK-like family protein [Undibacterium sp. Jales W-56]
MSTLRRQLAERRKQLLSQTQAQRDVIAEHGRQLKQSMQFADLGLQVARQVKKQPAIGIGFAIATIIIKPGRMWRLLKTGLVAWNLWQNLAPVLKNAAAPKRD